MNRIDTLTAYRCQFTFLQRNNPLIEEQREAIRNGETPKYTFSEFFTEYAKYAEKIVKGENTDRAILLSDENIICSLKDDMKKWHIIPSSGKQGKPVTVIKNSGKRYDFGSDTAALYKHHVFAYENEEYVIMIFHRQSGSGCKSVFLETANKFLKPKGLKLEMELILPLTEDIANATPTKLILQSKRQSISSDVADSLRTVKQKSVIIKELGLNLEVQENNPILSTFKQMQLGIITKEAAFATIRAAIGNGNEDYNDAEVSIKVGRRTRRIQWQEFENLFGVYDVTSQLRDNSVGPQEFATKLEQLSDEYYKKIVSSKEV